MVNKKLTPLILLCFLLTGINACSRYVVAGATAAGVAAGAYFYVKGDLKRNYEAPIEKVWEASLQAVKDLELTVESEKHDAFGGTIKGKMADGTNFQINLETIGEKSTEVGIRIGVFGDRAKSEVIHAKILSKL